MTVQTSVAPIKTRPGKAERGGLPLNVMRMVGLRSAAAMLGGQARLAEAVGIDARSLRAKLTADRGVSNADLMLAAAALDARAARIAALADNLRVEAGAAVAASTTPFFAGELK